MEKALEGIRVLDLSRMYSGPIATMILGELGADVIKAEIPISGDAMRTVAPQTPGQEGYLFIILNRGKRSITLDLHSETGQKIARDLVRKCDILVENFTPGVMERFGLGYEALKKISPSLIYASISGFGHTGPNRLRAAFDTSIQALGGLLSVNGQPGSPPSKVGPAIADFTAGVQSVISILAALEFRRRSGKGQFIDISMQDCIWSLTATQFLPVYVSTGQEPKKPGNRMVEVTPFSIYRSKDGYVVIATTTVGQWQRLLDVIGRQDLKNVSKYAVQTERIKYVDEVDNIVESWTIDKTAEQIVKTLEAADLPCASVPSFSEVYHDPNLASRSMVTEVEQLLSGPVKVPGSPYKMSETPGDPTCPSPFLGQHNVEVYNELLGYSEEEINRLLENGVI